MQAYILILLSIIGAVEAVYLIKKRIASNQPLCFLGGDCEVVLTSQYNKTFFIYNDILGAMFYVTVFSANIVLLLNLYNPELINLFIHFLIIFGSLMSLRFTYIQWNLLEDWCSWCLLSAVVTWLMLFTILFSGLF